MIVIVD